MENLRSNTNKTYQQVFQRLQCVWSNWTKTQKMKEEISDLMQLERLVDLMESGMKTWVRQQHAKSEKNAAHLADEFCQSEKSPGDGTDLKVPGHRVH